MRSVTLKQPNSHIYYLIHFKYIYIYFINKFNKKLNFYKYVGSFNLSCLALSVNVK